MDIMNYSAVGGNLETSPTETPGRFLMVCIMIPRDGSLSIIVFIDSGDTVKIYL